MTPAIEVLPQSPPSLLHCFQEALVYETSTILQGATRDAAIFSRLLGLDGSRPESLRKTAGHYNLTAERVRQIRERINEAAIPVIATDLKYERLRERISEAVALIYQQVPGSSLFISETIAAQSLADNVAVLIPPEEATAVIRLATLLGLNGRVRIEKWGKQEALVAAEMPNCFQLLITYGRKIASASGAVNTGELAEHFGQVHNIQLNAQEVNAMLKPCATFVLQEAEGKVESNWYSFADGGNDALTRARNRIGTLGWCSLAQLGAVEPAGTRAADTESRSFTRSKHLIKLPEAVLSQVLLQNGFVIKDDRVSLKQVAEKNKLSAVQERMIGIMRKMSNGVPVKQTVFLAACTEAGLKPSTTRIYLYRSGLFRCKDGNCELTP